MKPIVTTHDVLSPLPRLLVEPIVRAALLEDLGRAGDITTDAVIPARPDCAAPSWLGSQGSSRA